MARKLFGAGFVLWVSFIVSLIAAWVTHVVVAISVLVSGAFTFGYAVLLVLGVFVPPVGVIHGIGVWFGAW